MISNMKKVVRVTRRTLMTWRQPTAYCHVTKYQNSSLLMNSLKLHTWYGFTYPSLRRCSPSQVATLNVRQVSPCQVSRIQLKPLITRWSSGVWRSTRLNAHQKQSSKRVPAGVHSGSGLLQNAFHKTSSVCSWSGNPNVLFPCQQSCHFHQLESS